jgi:hypothetical protein
MSIATDKKYQQNMAGTFDESFSVQVEFTESGELIFPEGTAQAKITEVTNFWEACVNEYDENPGRYNPTA